MNTYSINYEESKRFSRLVCDYHLKDSSLTPFIFNYPELASLKIQVAERRKYPCNRLVLQEVLREQYADLKKEALVQRNLELLGSPDTFTVCTAHQPIILGGPLFIFYKAIQTILLAKEASLVLSNIHVVPVFVLGAEDHDLQEIGHIHTGTQDIVWQTQQQGACGRMILSDFRECLQKLLSELNTKVPDEAWLYDILTESYQPERSLADAMRYLLHHLFGEYGLIVLNPDDRRLKAEATGIFHDEMLNQSAQKLVTETLKRLPARYASQASPREINLFHLDNSQRKRWVRQGKEWAIHDTGLTYTRSTWESLLLSHPERFSPNVILRPLFQELILPNLVFIGGGGELSYWLELKTLFEYHQVAYPLIILRQTVQWIDPVTHGYMHRHGMKANNLFMSKIDWLDSLNQHSPILDIFHQFFQLTEAQRTTLEEKIAATDPKLMNSFQAYASRSASQERKFIYKLKSRLRQQIKDKGEAFDNIHRHMFPSHTLQERVYHPVWVWKWMGKAMLTDLFNNQDPWNKHILIMESQTNQNL